MMKEHRDDYYGGVSWANELAKRGFVVLVHDAFAFASRRVRAADLPPVVRKDLKEVNPESPEEINAYNTLRRSPRKPDGQEPLLRRHDLAGRLHGRGPARASITCARETMSTRPASAVAGFPAAGFEPSISAVSTIASAAPAASE